MTAAPHDPDAPHVVSVGTLLGVWLALMVLTGLTVGVATIDLGRASMPVALAIATVKAALVALFFMHLWWDSRANRVVLVGSVVCLVVFVAIVVLDAREYQPEVEWRQAPLAAPARSH